MALVIVRNPDGEYFFLMRRLISFYLVNVDDEFDALAIQSAALFASNEPSNEPSNFRKNEFLEANKHERRCFKRYPENLRNSMSKNDVKITSEYQNRFIFFIKDPAIELIIEKATREYQEKLAAILKGRKLTCMLS